MFNNPDMLAEIDKMKSAQDAQNVNDHSLGLAVGNEIFRIRKRIRKLPEDLKGITPILKSLERLEHAFNTSGYTLIDLQGKPYSDGMNVKAGFVTSGAVETGKQIITLVVRPQINYNNVLIQQAEIEVTIGE